MASRSSLENGHRCHEFCRTFVLRRAIVSRLEPGSRSGARGHLPIVRRPSIAHLRPPRQERRTQRRKHLSSPGVRRHAASVGASDIDRSQALQGRRGRPRTVDLRACGSATAYAGPRPFQHLRDRELPSGLLPGVRRALACPPFRHRRQRSTRPRHLRQSSPVTFPSQIFDCLGESDVTTVLLLDLGQHLVEAGPFCQAGQFSGQVLLEGLPAQLSSALKRDVNLRRNVPDEDVRHAFIMLSLPPACKPVDAEALAAAWRPNCPAPSAFHAARTQRRAEARSVRLALSLPR